MRSAAAAPAFVFNALDDRDITRVIGLWTQSCLDGDEHFYLEEAEQCGEDEFTDREQAQEAVLKELPYALARGRMALIRTTLDSFLRLAGIDVDEQSKRDWSERS